MPWFLTLSRQWHAASHSSVRTAEVKRPQRNVDPPVPNAIGVRQRHRKLIVFIPDG